MYFPILMKYLKNNENRNIENKSDTDYQKNDRE